MIAISVVLSEQLPGLALHTNNTLVHRASIPVRLFLRSNGICDVLLGEGPLRFQLLYSVSLKVDPQEFAASLEML